MLFRDGAVAAEGWRWPYAAHRPRNLHSVAKSFKMCIRDRGLRRLRRGGQGLGGDDEGVGGTVAGLQAGIAQQQPQGRLGGVVAHHAARAAAFRQAAVIQPGMTGAGREDVYKRQRQPMACSRSARTGVITASAS